MKERDRWGSERVRERGRLLKRERERERGVSERKKDEESMRMGKERKSPGKTDVPKLYTYNECELSVFSVQESSPRKNFELTTISHTFS